MEEVPRQFQKAHRSLAWGSAAIHQIAAQAVVAVSIDVDVSTRLNQHAHGVFMVALNGHPQSSPATGKQCSM
jgi:hypothetical protein